MKLKRFFNGWLTFTNSGTDMQWNQSKTKYGIKVEGQLGSKLKSSWTITIDNFDNDNFLAITL